MFRLGLAQLLKPLHLVQRRIVANAIHFIARRARDFIQRQHRVAIPAHLRRHLQGVTIRGIRQRLVGREALRPEGRANGGKALGFKNRAGALGFGIIAYRAQGKFTIQRVHRPEHGTEFLGRGVEAVELAAQLVRVFRVTQKKFFERRRRQHCGQLLTRLVAKPRDFPRIQRLAERLGLRDVGGHPCA